MRYMTKLIYCNPDFKMLYGYSHPSTNLIQLIFNGKDIEMMLDLNEMFTRTVFNRIKKEDNKIVTLDTPYIHISQHQTTTRLYPRWKHINPKKLEHHQRDINNGFLQFKDANIDQYYLVYPKTDNFRSHITLKDQLSQELKMIPYSFTFLNREKRSL